MPRLDLGVIARTSKENEHRLPIHPLHLDRLDPDVARHVYLEEGYGADFGITDEALRPLVAGLLPRAELIDRCDVILLTKPSADDLLELREGQVLWGWPHCVQDAALTQAAIDRRLTLVAWEAMNHWSADGAFLLHVFHKNNELAGYGSVLHAMSLAGITGTYGRRLNAAVIGFGATARGAVTALTSHGIHDVDIFTQRGVAAVSAPIHSARIVHFDPAASPAESRAHVDGTWVPRHGTPTRRCAAPSRSATASCRTRRSCSSRAGRLTSRTTSPDAGPHAPGVGAVLSVPGDRIEACSPPSRPTASDPSGSSASPCPTPSRSSATWAPSSPRTT